MKVKFPQYKVTLVVSSHGAMHIEEYRTTVVLSQLQSICSTITAISGKRIGKA